MSQIRAGAALNYVVIGLNTVVGLAYTPYMLRCLGQNEYGLYALVASVIGYLTLLDLGLGNAVVRYTARLRAEGKTREQWEMFGMFTVMYTVIGLVALGAGTLLCANVDRLFDRTMGPADLSQARAMMALLVANLAVTFPLSIYGAVITAYEHFVFQRVVQIMRITLCTLVLAAVLCMGHKAVALVSVQTVFNVLTLLLNYVYCRRRLKIKVWFRGFDRTLLRETATYSFWIFLNVIMDRIYWGTGQFVLGAVSGTAAVAVFSVAITLQQMYMTFSTGISGVLLPRITAMVSRGGTQREISDIFIRTGRLQAAVMFLVLSGFTVFGRGFIEVWAGAGYARSYTVAMIFFVALFIPLTQNTGIIILQARNQLRFRSVCYVVIAAASLGLQVWLAHPLGPSGCAVAIGGALLVGQGLVMNIYYRSRQGIDIGRFWREIGRMAAVPLGLTALGLLSCQWVDYARPQALAAGIAVYILVYAAAACRWQLNAYERGLALQAVNKLMRMLGHSARYVTR